MTVREHDLTLNSGRFLRARQLDVATTASQPCFPAAKYQAQCRRHIISARILVNALDIALSNPALPSRDECASSGKNHGEHASVAASDRSHTVSPCMPDSTHLCHHAQEGNGGVVGRTKSRCSVHQATITRWFTERSGSAKNTASIGPGRQLPCAMQLVRGRAGETGPGARDSGPASSHHLWTRCGKCIPCASPKRAT